MDAQVQLVHYYLDNELNENAFFITERLCAANPDDLTWTHLRSLSCLRLGHYALAADFSRHVGIAGKHLGCSYVFAQSCLQLKSCAEGIEALNEARSLWSSRKYFGVQSPPERYTPDFAAVNRLLGKLYQANGDNKTAAAFFAAALEENPFLWDAFTDLCDSGTTLRVPNIFKLRDRKTIHKGNPAKSTLADADSPNLVAAARNPNRQRKPLTPAPPSTSQPHNSEKTSIFGDDLKTQKDDKTTPIESENLPESQNSPASKKRLRSGLNPAPTEASPRVRWLDDDVLACGSSGSTHSQAPRRRSARLMSKAASVTASVESSSSGPDPPKATDKRPAKPKNPCRRTGRPTPSTSPELGLAELSSPKKEDLPCTISKPKHDGKECDTKVTVQQPGPEQFQSLLELLREVGSGYYHLSRFQPKECLAAFSCLPVEQQSTPWVLAKTARAHYEQLAYEEAKATFQVLRKLAPGWMEDLEVYSTVLWHLKEDVLLAHLAHELSDTHFLAPQTWCAVGNSFAVQRFRSEAVKAFRRACQLTPHIPQSFSLLGYEYLEMEDHAEAAAAFRRALQVDRRHYPAWVGLGRVHEKLGDSEKALHYYMGAEKINPRNAILMTYIARALEQSGNHGLALEHLRRGLELDPPEKTLCLIRMQTASIYIRLAQPAEALQNLRRVEQSAPDEARVHLMLGQAYAMSGEEHRGAALKCYTTALSLAPWSDEVKLAISNLESGL